MSITLDALTLPDDLIWIDEFDWTPMEQNKSYTLTGALVIESGQKQAGRPITLAGGSNAGWAVRSLAKALYTKLTGDPTMTLTLHDGSTHSVKFLMENPVEAKPVIDYRNPDDTDYYTLKIKLLKI